MKRFLPGLFLLLFFNQGCKKSQSGAFACGVDSFEQLTWAQDLISGKGACEFIYEGATMTMYDYKGQKVFHFQNPFSSLGICTQAVYNCSGEVIISLMSPATTYLDFEQKRKNGKVVWKKP